MPLSTPDWQRNRRLPGEVSTYKHTAVRLSGTLPSRTPVVELPAHTCVVLHPPHSLYRSPHPTFHPTYIRGSPRSHRRWSRAQDSVREVASIIGGSAGAPSAVGAREAHHGRTGRARWSSCVTNAPAWECEHICMHHASGLLLRHIRCGYITHTQCRSCGEAAGRCARTRGESRAVPRGVWLRLHHATACEREGTRR